jgi:hypothetical protein
MLDEDDDYYDEDDEYDDQEDEEGGKGALILVGVLVLIAVGAVAFAVMLLTGGEKSGDGTEQSGPGDLAGASGDGESGATDAADGLSSGFDFGDMGGLDDGTGEDGQGTASTPESGTSGGNYTPPTPRSGSGGTSPPSRTPRRSPPPSSSSNDVVIDYGGGSGSSGSTGSSGSAGSSGDTADPYADEATPSEGTPEPTPEAPPPAATAAADPNLSYESPYLKSLASSASSGSLESSVLSHLRAAPEDHPNYWLAWATVMKNSEGKKDYKGHCDATERVMLIPRFRYNPEFNLEMAKCHLRNSRLEKAVDSADRTIGNAMDLSASSKTQRLLLAYKIRAKCRGLLYAIDARSAAGLGDSNKINMAIQAWTDYSNYATGIGNSKAQQEADRELADLKARNGK